jgi:hypothetical protein
MTSITAAELFGSCSATETLFYNAASNAALFVSHNIPPGVDKARDPNICNDINNELSSTS